MKCDLSNPCCCRCHCISANIPAPFSLVSLIPRYKYCSNDSDADIVVSREELLVTPQTNIASIRKQIDREIVPEEAVLQGGGYKVMSTSTKAETEMRDRGCLHSCCSVERMCVYVKNHVCAYWYLLVRVLILLFTVSPPSLSVSFISPQVRREGSSNVRRKPGGRYCPIAHGRYTGRSE